MSLNYSHTNAHMAGSICATRPNRSSGRRRPPRWRLCRSATHRSALRSIDQRSIKVGFRSENAAGTAADPSGAASTSSALPRAEKRRGGGGPSRGITIGVSSPSARRRLVISFFCEPHTICCRWQRPRPLPTSCSYGAPRPHTSPLVDRRADGESKERPGRPQKGAQGLRAS